MLIGRKGILLEEIFQNQLLNPYIQLIFSSMQNKLYLFWAANVWDFKEGINHLKILLKMQNLGFCPGILVKYGMRPKNLHF